MNQQKEEQHCEAQIPSQNNQQSAAQIQISKESQYKNEYLQNMSPYADYVDRIMKRTNIKEYYLFEQFKIVVQQESINRQVVVYYVQWNNFQIIFGTLNIKGQNIHRGGYLNSGSFGEIYAGQFNNCNFAIKCLHTESTKNIIKAIKQFFFIKLCSKFDISPIIRRYTGFQLLIFSECVQFAMEQCEQVTKETFKPEQLYESLAVMHKIHVVHQDIKPQNIMYSPSLKRLVFIDFGLSTFINEEIGTKTLTRFVGNVENCCPEMRRAYVSEQPTMVDLYYNDLYALTSSINTIKSLLEQQELIQFVVQVDEKNGIFYFSYLKEVYLKYLLYLNKQKQAQFFWDNAILQKQKKQRGGYYGQISTESLTVNHYQTSVLEFVEELIPNRGLNVFIQEIITQSHFETLEYTRFKILSDVIKDTIFDKQSLRNQDKFNYFNKRCQEIVEYQIVIQKSGSKTKEIKLSAQLFQNQEYWQSRTMFQYFISYLEFISFTDNKHLVNFSQREKVAKNFCKFVNNFIIDPLNGKQYIKLTILYILNTCINLQKTEYRRQQVMQILLRIHQFLVILDMGSGQQCFQWIISIYNHWSINKEARRIVLVKIQYFIQIDKLRKNKKSDMSRKKFIDLISDWVKKQKQQFTDKLTLKDYYKSPFIVQLGKQIMILMNFHDISTVQLTYIYHLIRNNFSSKKILCFLPLLYLQVFKKRQNRPVCKQIVNLFRHNFRDQQLFSQFSFQLYEKIMDSDKNVEITNEEIKQVNFYFQNFQDQDLLLYIELISTVSIWYMKKKSIQLDPYLFLQNGIFLRFFEILKTQWIVFLKQSNNSLHFVDHEIGDIWHLLLLIGIACQFPNNRIQQIAELADILKPEVHNNCPQCYNNSYICQSFIRIQTSFTHADRKVQRIKIKQSLSLEQQYEIRKQSIQIYQEIIGSLPQKLRQSHQIVYKINTSYLLESMNKLCVKVPEFETKIHGIYNYYRLMVKMNEIYHTFLHVLDSLPILMKLLFETNYSQFIGFCFDFNNSIGDLYTKRSYPYIRKQYKVFINQYLKQYERINIFHSLQTYRKDRKIPQIILFYADLMTGISDIKVKKKILKVIMCYINKIHYIFRRSIGLLVYSFTYQLSELKGKRCNRRCNNSLVKYAMSVNQSVPSMKKFKPKNKYQKIMFKKLRFYDKYVNEEGHSFRFKLK